MNVICNLPLLLASDACHFDDGRMVHSIYKESDTLMPSSMVANISWTSLSLCKYIGVSIALNDLSGNAVALYPIHCEDTTTF